MELSALFRMIAERLCTAFLKSKNRNYNYKMMSTYAYALVALYPITTITMTWRLAWLTYFTIRYLRKICKKTSTNENIYDFIVV